MENLTDILEKAEKGDETAILDLVIKFRPLIKKYSFKLNDDDGESELTLFLLELIHKLELNGTSFYNDACLISYLNTSVINEYRKLSQKKYMKSIMETCLEFEIYSDEENKYDGIEDEILVKELLNKLSDKQRIVIYDIYFNDENPSELAKKNKITRQAVHKTKVKALEILKKEFMMKEC